MSNRESEILPFELCIEHDRRSRLPSYSSDQSCDSKENAKVAVTNRSSTLCRTSSLILDDVDPNISNCREQLPLSRQITDTVTSSKNLTQCNEIEDERVKKLKENLRKQVIACSKNCLRDIVDRLCYAGTPVSKITDKSLRAIIDCVQMTENEAKIAFQIALGVCMVDCDESEVNFESKYHLSYFGSHLCRNCFNVLFMRSQPQEKQRSVQTRMIKSKSTKATQDKVSPLIEIKGKGQEFTVVNEYSIDDHINLDGSRIDEIELPDMLHKAYPIRHCYAENNKGVHDKEAQNQEKSAKFVLRDELLRSPDMKPSSGEWYKGSERYAEQDIGEQYKKARDQEKNKSSRFVSRDKMLRSPDVKPPSGEWYKGSENKRKRISGIDADPNVNAARRHRSRNDRNGRFRSSCQDRAARTDHYRGGYGLRSYPSSRTRTDGRLRSLNRKSPPSR
ncbi:hypothetical protein TrispH2_001675 [Trichoplax sp. H2]|nr:hypothetical protein TrispH2_001675 [Trichoplax sp. H2]|eukprot:RDD46023.1 hypothetical protein TrispH2_001675 [Trichoplax sp. H2]